MSNPVVWRGTYLGGTPGTMQISLERAGTNRRRNELVNREWFFS